MPESGARLAAFPMPNTEKILHMLSLLFALLVYYYSATKYMFASDICAVHLVAL
jgi:hypothetical protein